MTTATIDSDKFVRTPVPPGARRGKAKPHPRGRRVPPAARAEVLGLLADRPRRRDLLIEHLHLIQDAYGHISAAHLAALAEEMRLSPAEIYEVATFYAHFDVVRENETPPPPLTVRVCDGVACEMQGGKELLTALRAGLGRDGEADRVQVVRGPCMGRCDKGPVAAVGANYLTAATVETVEATARAGETTEAVPTHIGFEAYRAAGGYRLLADCLAGRRTVDEIVAALDDSGLRGLGGAGFPVGRKWRVVREQPAPRLMAVNADEGEPGTFKDRHCLAGDPHRVIEGALVAAWAVEADEVYFYVRDEYPAIRALLAKALDEVAAASLARPVLHLRRGAGAYICGEESAMMESIEGRRGLPRHRPPFAAEVGLFGRPTLINNVETLHWVRDILERGADWFAAQGRNGRKGLRLYSVSGRVRDPGVKRAPVGITMNELLAEHCGGMADGHVFRAYLPGGASGGILPASLADIPLDFGSLEEHGASIGSAAVIVLSDRDDMREVALNAMRFFEDESCGQCTPCRVGTEKAAALMAEPEWNAELLEELCRCMADASICGLGQAAPNAVRSILAHFPEDVS